MTTVHRARRPSVHALTDQSPRATCHSHNSVRPVHTHPMNPTNRKMPRVHPRSIVHPAFFHGLRRPTGSRHLSRPRVHASSVDRPVPPLPAAALHRVPPVGTVTPAAGTVQTPLKACFRTRAPKNNSKYSIFTIFVHLVQIGCPFCQIPPPNLAENSRKSKLDPFFVLSPNLTSVLRETTSKYPSGSSDYPRDPS